MTDEKNTRAHWPEASRELEKWNFYFQSEPPRDSWRIGLCLLKEERKSFPMKAYVITTGVVFGLLTLAHLWRIFFEDAHLARDPFFILITAVAAGLGIWSVFALRRSADR